MKKYIFGELHLTTATVVNTGCCRSGWPHTTIQRWVMTKRAQTKLIELGHTK